MKTLSKRNIAILNNRARAQPDCESDPVRACRRVAPGALIATSETCEVYRTTRGYLVNLWIQGVQSEAIEDGGTGFDDQWEWAFEEK